MYVKIFYLLCNLPLSIIVFFIQTINTMHLVYDLGRRQYSHCHAKRQTDVLSGWVGKFYPSWRFAWHTFKSVLTSLLYFKSSCLQLFVLLKISIAFILETHCASRRIMRLVCCSSSINKGRINNQTNYHQASRLIIFKLAFCFKMLFYWIIPLCVVIIHTRMRLLRRITKHSLSRRIIRLVAVYTTDA